MYCKCKEPKKKTISIMRDVVEVCAKSKGGCGCEINQVIECPVKWSDNIPPISEYNSDNKKSTFEYVDSLMSDCNFGDNFFDYRTFKLFIKGNNKYYELLDNNIIEINP